jgi:non-ribosomal peptide synthetase component E (peptide arylation enzyme)
MMRDVVTPPERRAAYERAGLWDDVTLAGQVRRWAAERPDDVAVVDDAGARTYADLGADAGRVAGFLTAVGVEAGSVVSIQLPNRYEAVVTAVAVQSLGGVINPLLPNYRAKELGYVCQTATPRVLVTPAEYRGFDHRDLVTEVCATTGLDAVHLVVDDGAGGGDARFADVLDRPPELLGAARADAVSELIFTSGTEANPKAIMHTEQTANFSVRVAYADLGLGRDDVVWMPSPVGHSTGFNYGVRFALYHGLRLVLQDRWDADDAVALVAEQRCSYTLAATTFLQDLVAAATRGGAHLDQLRCFGCGGAPVPAELVRAARARGIGVLRLYGSTEVLVGTWNRPESLPDRQDTTDGIAMSDVEIEVRGEDGRRCAPNEPGELYVRGPNTCVGFFRDAERTAATFSADGWVRSGDLVNVDRDGYLTVVGRKKEIIIRGGMNIAPREIEELLVAFPEVDRAAVVGLPDARLGERSCACVVVRPGETLDLATALARLRTSGLAAYKLPERLEVLDALPTTASGKVQKHEIVRQLTTADAS